MPEYLDDGRYVPIPEFWRDPVHRALFIEPEENALSHSKAREMLRHGEVRGHALTARQKRFFGAIAGGQRPRK